MAKSYGIMPAPRSRLVSISADQCLPPHQTVDGSFLQHATPQPQPVALSIISNSPLLREGLISLLGQHMVLNLIGSYSDKSTQSPPLPNPPDHVVLLDGSMDPAALIDWIHYWRAINPPASVVIIHMPDDDDLVIAAINAGVSAYVRQGATTPSLSALLTLVQQDLVYCAPRQALNLATRLVKRHDVFPKPRESPSFTPRELEILQGLAENRDNREIANCLIIEVGTVKHHVHNILEKLNVRHRWEAAQLAVEQGWVTPRTYVPGDPEQMET